MTANIRLAVFFGAALQIANRRSSIVVPLHIARMIGCDQIATA